MWRKAMKRNHLIAIAVGALILSSSNIGLAQAGSHKEEKKSHSKQAKPIKVKHESEVRIFDTSTVIPISHFDTSTAGSQIDIDEEDGDMPRFDTTTATSHGEDSDDQGEHGDHGEHGEHGEHGDHDDQDDQGDHDDSFSGSLPASPLGTRNS